MSVCLCALLFYVCHDQTAPYFMSALRGCVHSVVSLILVMCVCAWIISISFTGEFSQKWQFLRVSKRMVHMDKMKGVHGIVRFNFCETKQNMQNL